MWLWPLTAFLSVCVIIGGLIYLTSGPQQGAGTAADPNSAPVIGTKARERAALEQVEENQSRDTAALDKARRQHVLDLGEELLGLVDELEAEAKRWQSEFPSLLTNDEGKSIATDKMFVSAYRREADTNRPGKREVAGFRARVGGLIKPAKQAADQPTTTYTPSDELMDQLEREREPIEKALQEMKEARRLLDGMRVQAKQSGAKGTLTLKEAIDQVAAEEAKERAAVIDAASRKAREEETRRLAREQEETERQEGRKQVEIEAARRVAMLAQKERERVMTLANDPAVQAKYQAFLKPGKFLFDKRQFNQGDEFSLRPAPVSFRRLMENWCLKDAKRFAQAMCGLSVRQDDNWPLVDASLNDRPKATWPRNEADWKRWEEMYAQFLELAPHWLEMGLLAK